jgi:Uma2 family endonuclease
MPTKTLLTVEEYAALDEPEGVRYELLAIEIVSQNDRADDLLIKVSQYLHAGAQAVWLMYPKPRLAYRYVRGKLEPEVRAAAAGGKFEEPELLPGFSLPLAEVPP